MNKLINYFFDEEEKELVEKYKFLVILGIVSIITSILGVIA